MADPIISQEVNIEMLEKLADGTFKIKYPKTKADLVIGLTKGHVGLGNVENYGVATQAEAEAGTSNAKYMTPLRVQEALKAELAIKPGDSVIYFDATVSEHKTTTWTKVKEARVWFDGGVRVKFTGQRVIAYGARLRVYINGAPVGIERSLGSSYVEYEEDFTVSNGDLIQIYAWTYNTSETARVKDFKICINKGTWVQKIL